MTFISLKKNFYMIMKKVFLIFPAVVILAFSFQATVSAQTKSAKLKATSLKKGKVQLARGAVKSIIDLSKDVSGCITVYDRSDPKVKMDTTNISLFDTVVKGGKTYVVLLAEINSGCNITGECGAATDTTLVWLKLNSALKVESKKAVVVQSCFWGDIHLTEESGDIKLKGGKLSLQIETNRFKSDLEYSVSTVTYDRAAPEKGLEVKTEKPPRPVN
jgi:hypothetical protein